MISSARALAIMVAEQYILGSCRIYTISCRTPAIEAPIPRTLKGRTKLSVAKPGLSQRPRAFYPLPLWFTSAVCNAGAYIDIHTYIYIHNIYLYM